MSSSEVPETAPILPPSKGYRGWRAVVIILGALNLVAFGAVVTAFIVRTGRTADAPQAYESIVPTRGQLIESVNMDANRVLLRLSGPEGQELVVLDLNTGRLIGRIRLPSSP